jgi:hypothetical protein
VRFYVLALALIVAFATSELVGEKPLPPGWRWTSARPDTANCKAFHGERPSFMSSRSISLRCTTPDPGFAAVRYAFPVEEYRGKLVTLIASVKITDVKDKAQMWLRADREGEYGAAINRMDERPLKGTSDWVTISISLEVPKDATVLMSGLLLYGSGTISAQGLQISTDLNNQRARSGISTPSPTSGTQLNTKQESKVVNDPAVAAPGVAK